MSRATPPFPDGEEDKHTVESSNDQSTASSPSISINLESEKPQLSKENDAVVAGEYATGLKLFIIVVALDHR